MTAAARRPVAAVLVGACAALLSIALASPASASCAEQPQPSPHRFVGTVVETGDDGSLATVVLDDGARVEVVGGPGAGEGSATSVDRRYAEGGRYEFHPRNAQSPFQDDACTATRQLAGPTPQQPQPRADRLPGWLPVDEQAGVLGYGWLVGGALLVAAAGVAVVRR